MINKIYVYGDDAHGHSVYDAFVQALTDNGITWTGEVVYGTADFATALAAGCQLYLKSTTGMSGAIAAALACYPALQVIMPAGSNTPNDHIYDSGGVLPNIIVTGGGDTQNETAYDIEFFSNDPVTVEATPDEQDLSSFSNGYIAGQLTAITNITGCTFAEARTAARATGSRNGVWINTDGYGKINVGAAVASIVSTLTANNAQLTADNAALVIENTRLSAYEFTTGVAGITLTKETKYGTSGALTLGKITIEENSRVAVMLKHCLGANDLDKEPLEIATEYFDNTFVKDFIYTKYCEAKEIDLSNLIVP